MLVIATYRDVSTASWSVNSKYMVLELRIEVTRAGNIKSFFSPMVVT